MMKFSVSTDEQRSRGARTTQRNMGHMDGVAGVKARSQEPEYLAAYRLGVKDRTGSLSNKTCARPECRKKLPELAVQHEDPYCSTQCCRIERGLNPSTAGHDLEEPDETEFAGGGDET